MLSNIEKKECFFFSNYISHSFFHIYRRGTILETCPYMTISAFQWYPTQINGYKFRGRNADFFQLPDTLLEVPAGVTADCGNLSRIQLTEFKTEHWFLTNDTTKALNGKVRKCWASRCNYRYKLQGALFLRFKLVVHFFPVSHLRS